MSDVHPHARGGFIEHTLEGLHRAMERAMYAESAASRNGLLQRLDARVKVAGLFSLIVAVALAAKLWLIAAVIGLAIILALFSAISLRALAMRAWLGALLFSGTIAAPALFLTPGTSFHGLPITLQGLRTAGFLVLRHGLEGRCGCPLPAPCAHVIAAALAWVRAGDDDESPSDLFEVLRVQDQDWLASRLAQLAAADPALAARLLGEAEDALELGRAAVGKQHVADLTRLGLGHMDAARPGQGHVARRVGRDAVIVGAGQDKGELLVLVIVRGDAVAGLDAHEDGARAVVGKQRQLLDSQARELPAMTLGHGLKRRLAHW